MPLMVTTGSEMIRYNPSANAIEASSSKGFSWSMRYRCSGMGNIRALTMHKGEIILCSTRESISLKALVRPGQSEIILNETLWIYRIWAMN